MNPLLPGRGHAFGAVPRDGGVDFALWSPNASAVDLCLFDPAGRIEEARWPMHGPHMGEAGPPDVWHGFLPGASPGLVYGLRVHGPWAPELGHRFNPAKLLLDPYARGVVGEPAWHPALWPHATDHWPARPGDDMRTPDPRDSAPWALKAQVMPAHAPWPAAANRPRPAMRDRVLLEVHPRGATRLHPAVPQAQRGTYAALAHPALLEHWKRIGITTLSLMPVAYALDEPHLAARGLRNRWGYNTIAFFVPDPRHAQHPHDPLRVEQEFAQMVEAMHGAGFEVVLDVVFNHTAEGGADGPMLSMRGCDQAAWYRQDAADASRFADYSGCGNTLDASRPEVMRFVLDALRHWAGHYGVDGFRFDLASALARDAQGRFDAAAPLLQAIGQDPLLADRLLIAEPWDATWDGWQVGRFPGRWLEWNDRFRDTLRRTWLLADAQRGASSGLESVTRGELARRMAASSDRFQHDGRLPASSINFVAVHDGFTLADLTRYAERHNEANGEGNADGRRGEPSANFGWEGIEGDDHGLAREARRRRVRRALLAGALLAQGTPMLQAGDERGHGQAGSNNAYAQDTAIDWQQPDDGMTAFTARVAALRRREPALRHARWWLHGPTHRNGHGDDGMGAGGGERSVTWFSREAAELDGDDWQQPASAGLVLRIDGDPLDAAQGHALLLVCHPDDGEAELTLPKPGPWRLLLDSARGEGDDWASGAPAAAEPAPLLPGARVALAGVTLQVWTQVRAPVSDAPAAPSIAPR